MIAPVLPNTHGIVHYGNRETVEADWQTHAGQHEQVW